MATSQAKLPQTVLLGVTGCIAAYKSAEIVRGLQKAGIRVKVVMTEHACEFVAPTTFRALTNEPVATRLFDEPEAPIHHISLAKEADLFLIAPCTANVMAKLAWGIADDILTTTALASTSPLLVAPAMNVQMYENAATKDNMVMLKERGVKFIEPDEGYLACGDVGKGRLADVDAIITYTLEVLGNKQDLVGKNVLITAGPTVEAIDPVRYISNNSSGKMGYALAKAALYRGAKVTLVSGPVFLPVPDGVMLVPVTSALEMLEAAQKYFAAADIAIFSAAVCDMRPLVCADKKLKKGGGSAALQSIKMVENPDILATLAAEKTASQVVVGFAAETDAVIENGKKKLASKGADLIVANEVGKGKVFGKDLNKAWLISNDETLDLPEMSKFDLAHKILDKCVLETNSN